MVLRECPAGQPLRLRRLAVGRRERARLVELGFVPGAWIRVVGRASPAGWWWPWATPGWRSTPGWAVRWSSSRHSETPPGADRGAGRQPQRRQVDRLQCTDRRPAAGGQLAGYDGAGEHRRLVHSGRPGRTGGPAGHVQPDRPVTGRGARPRPAGGQRGPPFRRCLAVDSGTGSPSRRPDRHDGSGCERSS
jgi:hypothetical protein